MIGIPDWNGEPLADLETIAKSQLMLDAELTGPHLKPLVLDLDTSVHSHGHKCGDVSCPCATDDTFI